MQVLKEFKFNPSENTFIELCTESRSIRQSILNFLRAIIGRKKKSVTESMVCDNNFTIFTTQIHKGEEIIFESVNKIPLDQITDVTTIFYQVGLIKRIIRLFSLSILPMDFGSKENFCLTTKAGADGFSAFPLFIFKKDDNLDIKKFKEAADLLAELSAKKVR